MPVCCSICYFRLEIFNAKPRTRSPLSGFWHSAFFGRTPSAFIHYHWFLKMLEDEQAEIRCVAVCVCVCVCLCLCVCVCVPCFCVRVNASREWGCKC